MLGPVGGLWLGQTPCPLPRARRCQHINEVEQERVCLGTPCLGHHGCPSWSWLVPACSCLLGWKLGAAGRPGPGSPGRRTWPGCRSHCWAGGAPGWEPCPHTSPAASEAVLGGTRDCGAAAAWGASSSTTAPQSLGSDPGPGNPALWQGLAQEALTPITPRA